MDNPIEARFASCEAVRAFPENYRALSRNLSPVNRDGAQHGEESKETEGSMEKIGGTMVWLMH